MIIKERVSKKCACCGRDQFVSDEEYGCDNCKKPIILNSNSYRYLEANVFSKSEKEAERLQFCSWKCVFAKLRKVKSKYFITLPELFFDINKEGMTVKDFWECIK